MKTWVCVLYFRCVVQLAPRVPSNAICFIKDEPRPPSPGPSFEYYDRETENRTGNWSSVEIRLVGSHPLWGHHLYAFNAQDEHLSELIERRSEGGTPPERLRRILMTTHNCIKTKMSLNSGLVVGCQGLLLL